MAVLLLSLHSLHQGRIPRPEMVPSVDGHLAPMVRTVQSPVKPSHTLIEAPQAATRLGFSQSEVEALVQQAGPDAGRLLLSLICRVASVESELAELRQQISRAPAYAAAPAPQLRQVVQPDASSSGRSALLEKVFQNNMMLWKLIEGDL